MYYNKFIFAHINTFNFKEMKKIVYLLFVFVLFSCNSSVDGEVEPQLLACFNTDKEVVQVGEIITITNCSENVKTYSYDFGNGEVSNEISPQIFYKKGGEYIIKLEVKDADGKRLIVSKKIKVLDVSSNFIELPFFKGDWFYPLTTGFNGDKLFYVEFFQNIDNSSSPRKINYVQYDLNTLTIEKKFVHDNVLNVGRASVNFLNSSKRNIIFPNTLTNSNGGIEVELDANFNVLGSKGWNAVYYGFIPNSNEYLYYGSKYSNGASKPSIEIRDENGVFKERKTFSTIEQGFIGSLLKTDNGFIAFGGSSKPTNSSGFENYKPLIFFLDANFNLIKQKMYEVNFSSEIKNYNATNGTYNLTKLTNGNYASYAHGNIILINSEGEQVKIIKVNNAEAFSQSLLAIKDGFIITRESHIEKYSNDGVLIKSIEFKGDITPKLIEKNNKIYFVSGYLTTEKLAPGNVSIFKSFIGAVNYDLTPVSLKK